MNTFRRSKIAQLPKPIREELNRRLEDAEPGPQLVEWLNQLPRVHALLAAQFAGQPITTQNLSHWRRHGYQDWLRQQQTVEVVRNLSADNQELLNASRKRSLTDQIAVALAARFAVIARELAAKKDDPANWRHLHELTRDVVALRRGDHSSRRLKMEETLFDEEGVNEDEDIIKRFKKWAKYGHIREWLEQQDLKKKERERRLRIYLGFDESTPEPPTAAESAHKEKMERKMQSIMGNSGGQDASPSRIPPSAFHRDPSRDPELIEPIAPLPPSSSSSSSLPAPVIPAAAVPITPTLQHSAAASSAPIIDRTSAKAAAAMPDSERFLTPIIPPPMLR